MKNLFHREVQRGGSSLTRRVRTGAHRCAHPDRHRPDRGTPGRVGSFARRRSALAVLVGVRSRGGHVVLRVDRPVVRSERLVPLVPRAPSRRGGLGGHDAPRPADPRDPHAELAARTYGRRGRRRRDRPDHRVERRPRVATRAHQPRRRGLYERGPLDHAYGKPRRAPAGRTVRERAVAVVRFGGPVSDAERIVAVPVRPSPPGVARRGPWRGRRRVDVPSDRSALRDIPHGVLRPRLASAPPPRVRPRRRAGVRVRRSAGLVLSRLVLRDPVTGAPLHRDLAPRQRPAADTLATRARGGVVPRRDRGDPNRRALTPRRSADSRRRSLAPRALRSGPTRRSAGHHRVRRWSGARSRSRRDRPHPTFRRLFRESFERVHRAHDRNRRLVGRDARCRDARVPNEASARTSKAGEPRDRGRGRRARRRLRRVGTAPRPERDPRLRPPADSFAPGNRGYRRRRNALLLRVLAHLDELVPRPDHPRGRDRRGRAAHAVTAHGSSRENAPRRMSARVRSRPLPLEGERGSRPRLGRSALPRSDHPRTRAPRARLRRVRGNAPRRTAA